MASTLQVRVEDYTGTISDTTSITDQATAGVKLFVNSIPESKLDTYAVDITDGGTGIDVTNHRVFRAHKSGYPARLISPELKTQAGLTTSIHYATTTSPVWCVEKTKGYVLPSGGSITGVIYPTVTYQSTSISAFPTEWEHGVVLYIAIQQLIGKANASLDSLQALSMDSVTAPTTPTAPSFTWTDAAIDTITATTIGSLGTTPVYTKPTTTFSVTTATTYIGTNEDGALASAELQKQQALLDQYGKDLYNELNEVNAEIEGYKAGVQKVIDQAKLDQDRLIQQSTLQVDLNKFNEMKTLEEQIAEYSATMQKFLEDINLYQANIQKAVQKYATDISKYSTALQTGGATIKNLQDELNRILSTI